jgi:hypothetical protein
MKCGKAAGPDLVLNEMLKTSVDTISGPLASICNLILSSESYPDSWVSGIISLIHKGGAVGEIDNYRGITVSSCSGKVLTAWYS